MSHNSMDECLVTLEDRTLYTNRSYVKSFERLKSVLDESGYVRVDDIRRILAILQHCINHNMTNISYALAAVTSLLKMKALPKLAMQDYLPTALGLLHLIKTVCVKPNTMSLRSISIDLFLLYPVEVFAELGNCYCADLLEIFSIYRCTGPTGDRMSNEMCHFLHRLLNILPPDQRQLFAKNGTEIWFGDLIPTLMKGVAQENKDQYQIHLKCLEKLTQELVFVDYRDCTQWQICLRCICQSREYPTVIMKLLKTQNEMWCKIWMIFIKLLKLQITLNIGSGGTPINSMLPTVETAFKMDVKERCQAFRCWEVLIDTFSKETNENCLPKRMKLLLIPLKSNNAKLGEIALAKLNCWWHLISAFADHLNKFTCEVLLSFVVFSFGKIGLKGTISPGVAQLFDSYCRKKCIEAFVNIVGHHNCHCNTVLPRLQCTIMTSKVLLNHWTEWSLALKSVILLSAVDYETHNFLEENNPVPVLCAFKFTVAQLSEFPKNTIRRDLFNGLIKILMDLFDYTQTSPGHEKLAELVICMVLSLFEDKKYEDLLTCNVEDSPIKKLFKMVMHDQKHEIFGGYPPKDMIKILKPMTMLLVQNPKTVSLLDWLIDTIICKNSLILWTALVESILEVELNNIGPETVDKMLLWPVRSASRIQESKYAAMPWYRLYNYLATVTCNDALMKELATSKDSLGTNYFRLCVTVCLVKNKLSNDEVPDFAVLETMHQAHHGLELDDPLIPVLIDTFILMLDKATIQSNTELARMSLKFTLNVLTFLNHAGITNEENNGCGSMLTPLGNLFDAVLKMFQTASFTDVNTDFLKELNTYLLTLDKESPMLTFILTKFKNDNSNYPIQSVIDSTIDLLVGNGNNNNVKTNKPAQEFTIPEKKKVVKTLKKKEANIVNTVVENGEEYVVVKSNWKFNPRKLTENQKEKLQRKRDIPALYQDLSQSQEEFKLSTWKTDSQDTSTTTSTNSKSSKSSNLKEVSTALKNIDSSDVIPTIMENILSENDKNLAQEQNVIINIVSGEKIKPVVMVKSSPKTVKSPRVALKDRVFRNVRNLLENSKAKGDMIEKTDEHKINHVLTPDTCNTPTTKEKNKKDLLNSAPPSLTADRPSRLRKVPKKFNDVELFGMKKRRCSLDKNFLTESQESDSINNKNSTRSNKNQNVDVVDNNVEKVVLIDNTNQKMLEKDDVPENLPDLHTVVQVIIKREDDIDLFTGLPPKNTDSTKKDPKKNTDSTQNDPHKNTDSTQNDPHKNIDSTQNEPQRNTQNDNIISSNCDDANNHVISVSVADSEDAKKNRDCDSNNADLEILSEPVQTPLKNPSKSTEQNSTAKKTKTSSRKKSRIENELAIDMVEGHPFLQMQSPLRLTRKKLIETDSSKRKRNVEKLDKTKTTPRTTKKLKSKETGKIVSDSQTSASIHVEESQENNSPGVDPAYDGPPCSEDVIESSQDSTFTTISVKSTKQTLKSLKVNVVRLEKTLKANLTAHTQDLLQDSDCEILSQKNKSLVQESKDDSELPLNRTVEVEKNQSELTENMDTEPMSAKALSQEVILINDELTPVAVNSENSVGPETQELAEADTQPNNPDLEALLCDNTSSQHLISNSAVACADVNGSVTQEDITQMDTEPINVSSVGATAESESHNEEAQRKRDFLNDTSEISPIKVQSPEREKVPSPQETSSDYVLVKLSAPVESNGEPFDKSASPEFFTEDKISPEKREQSPPRSEITVNNTSPTSVLSLKKNRPQVRPGGRAAHMLGLCVPNSLNTIKNMEKPEPEDVKRNSTVSTPARRNLRLLYNAASEAADDGARDDAEDDNFLNFKKTLPSSDCSPSVPILKRKLADIADDATASPANKRKRVSFHDPPVSTTMSVQKYIEPGGTKSPSSAHKRLERSMTRSYAKSPKRLEFVKPNTAQLNTALCKAVESFTEEQLLSLTNDTMDVTPAVEIVKTSELNDTDPICPELVDCKDEIEKIATELSSPAMKDLFVKELEGKVATVGDLAKMTELEVNRLCIKAPKIQVAKKVLTDYVNKRKDVKIIEDVSINETALSKEMDEEMTEPEPKRHCIEVQTDKVSMCDSSLQTKPEVKVAMCQTNVASVATTSAQTKESGSQSTSDLITSCISERKDFVDCLSEQLNEESLRKMAARLSTDAVMDILTNDDSKLILNKILDRHSQNVPASEKNNMELAFINDYLLNKYDDRSMILFCSQLLQKIHDKPV